jgi:hypothetical protein
LKREFEKPSLILVAIGEYATLFCDAVLLHSSSATQIGEMHACENDGDKPDELRHKTTEFGRFYELRHRESDELRHAETDGRSLVCCVQNEPKAERCYAWLDAFVSQFCVRDARPTIILISTRTRCELRNDELDSDQLRRLETVPFHDEVKLDFSFIERLNVADSMTGLSAQFAAFCDAFRIPLVAFWLFTHAESAFATHISLIELFARFAGAFRTPSIRAQNALHANNANAASLCAFVSHRFELAETRTRIELLTREFTKKHSIAVHTKQQIYS